MKIILNENITGEGLQYLKKLENLITEFQTIDNDLKYCPNLTILNIEENEKITGLLSKQADGCNFDGQPIFTMLNNYKISSFSNKVHGRGLHSESVPVCRFKDCDNECTMLEFQILGLNLTVNNALTLQNVESTVEDSSLNTTTVLDYGVYGAGFAVLFCLVLLLLVLLYYSFIPKEYDFVSNTDTGLLYENAKDLLSL